MIAPPENFEGCLLASLKENLVLTTFRRISFSVLAAILLCSIGSAPRAQAEAAQGMLALAAPLAEQFGVPADAFTTLMESNVSLESVSQLLLISQSSKKDFGAVTEVFYSSNQSVEQTAGQLKVAASEYSKEKVTKTIDTAQAKLEADTREAAADGANKAIGSALGGLGQ
jgi:hypothetical protein